MPDPATGLVAGGSLIGGIMGGSEASSAAKHAANLQATAANQGIFEQQRQFNAMKKLLAPYVQAGTPALQEQQNILGIGPAGAQGMQDAYSAMSASPAMAAMLQQGENAMFQNASATGGLRGGNLQAAMAQFRPQLLNQLMEQQYARLGGMTSLGQNSAAMQGTAGMQTGQNIANLYGQAGQAQAGGAIGSAQANAQMWNMLPQLAGMFAGYGTPGGGTPSLSVPGGFTSALNSIDAGMAGSTPSVGSGTYNINF